MLEGLPTGFDWNAWDTYFNRFDGLSTQMGENSDPQEPLDSNSIDCPVAKN
jgi:hypothetical protein